ncbi:hypothetical protein ANTPLA_LOCUS3325 [Anthophora plagiata]
MRREERNQLYKCLRAIRYDVSRLLIGMPGNYTILGAAFAISIKARNITARKQPGDTFLLSYVSTKGSRLQCPPLSYEFPAFQRPFRATVEVGVFDRNSGGGSMLPAVQVAAKWLN